MTDASIIYNVVVNYQLKNGEKAAKTQSAVNKESQKQAKIFTGLNKIFQQGAVRMFSLIFLFRRMRDGLVNMLRPAAQMTGILDVWNMTLGLFFLPIMLALLPALLTFSDWLLSLPDGMKIALGALALVTIGALSFGIALIGLSIAMNAVGATSLVGFLGKLTGLFTGPLLTAATSLLRVMGLLGLVPLASVLLLFAALALVGIVLFALKDKFGTFGNAIKAWAAALVLAIAIVVQGAFDILMSPITAVITGLKYLLKLYNMIAGAIGRTPISTKGLDDFMYNMNTGLVTGAAVLLDKYGFNPEPVSSTSSSSSTPMSSQVDLMKANGMDNASIINSITRANQPAASSIVMNQQNTFNVADWQKYQAEMDKLKRQNQQDLDRLMATTQRG